MSAPDIKNLLENAQGHWVPKDAIEDIDLARNDLVLELVDKAEKLRHALQVAKIEIMADIDAFIDLSKEQYGVKVGGTKGNVTLLSFDARYKIQVQVSDSLAFDERLQAAKELIDECIHGWTDGSSPEISALIEHAFQVDKAGKINTGRVLGLRRLKIKDRKWKQAMEALSDSIQVVGSKPYLRFYKRDDAGKFQPISLDIAGV